MPDFSASNSFAAGPSTTHASGFPIACRVVPYDQWLVTHVETTWKVKDIKHWIMSKCNAWGSTTAPQPPRFRAASPVIFSGPSRRSSIDSSSFAGTEEGDGEDEWDVFAALEYNPENLVSESGLEKIASTPSLHTNVYTNLRSNAISAQGHEQAATSAKYTLVSFSGGYILEDDLDLAWYKPRPFELLEMHRAGAIVLLPRSGLAYVEPYFESPVQVSDRPHGPRRVSRTPGHKTHMSATSDEIDFTQDKGQNSNVEWKSRWAIVRDGVLHLCKESHTAPTHRFPISALCALGGPEQFGLPSRSNLRVICAKFRHFSLNETMVTVGERDSDDDVVVTTSSKSQPQRKQKQKLKSSSWVILEMPNRSSYEALLRILHRLAPHPLPSSFLPRTPTPSPVSPSSPHQVPFSPRDFSSPTQESFSSTGFFGVQYPEWRIALLARARQAGRGNIGPALTLAHSTNILASSDSVKYHEEYGTYSLSIFHQLPQAPSISESLRRWATNLDTSSREDADDTCPSERDSEGLSNNDQTDGWNQEAWKDAVSNVDEEDDVESEVEWDGWVRDLARRSQRPKCISILKRPQSPSQATGVLSSGPGSPSSSDYEISYGQSTSLVTGRSGTVRTRTVSSYSPIQTSQAPSPRAESSSSSRSRATTLGAFPNQTGFIPYTYSTTTTTITTYIDRVPDMHSSGQSAHSPLNLTTSHTAIETSLPVASSSSSEISPISTPRAPRRIPSQANALHFFPQPRVFVNGTNSLSSNISESGSEHGSLASTLNSLSNVESSGSGSLSGRNRSMGGVRRIVRGVSIRNAFSTERLVRGLEDALDFVDGR